jgi:16S rRNA processing protein RimM
MNPEGETKTSTNIYLGRLAKPFGIKGEFKFVESDDFWAGVLDSKRLVLQRPIEVERFRQHGAHFVVKLCGIDDRTLAEEVVGGELFVDAEHLDVDLPDYELPFQIVGSTVKTEDGRVVGEVKAVMFSAAHAVYEVEGEDGDVLIPAVPEFVVGRDREKGEITIRTIPGLID